MPKGATILRVEGPWEVGYAAGLRGAKFIEAEDGRNFFDDNDQLVGERGCYLFAIRSGRGSRAAYVGKATTGFEREVFTADKLQKYNKALHKWPHGSPVLFFVVMPPRTRSAPLIGDVERYLIRSTKRAWPELLNIHHAGPENWEILGITSARKGRRSAPESALAGLLKFKE